jgi:hypothetical protein
MAEANDEVQRWISMIKDHVKLEGIDHQEVHDFYSNLDGTNYFQTTASGPRHELCFELLW